MTHLGPPINDVTHLWGRGDLPKGEVTPQAYLVKIVTRGEREGSNISKISIIYNLYNENSSKFYTFLHLLCNQMWNFLNYKISKTMVKQYFQNLNLFIICQILLKSYSRICTKYRYSQISFLLPIVNL